MSDRIIGIACIAAIFGFDQGSKALALGYPALAEGVVIMPVLNLVLVYNDGVSFGMFGGVAPWWALTLLGLAVASTLFIWLLYSQSKLVSIALGLMIGGALGNVLDRVRHGAVIDFLDFHLADYHWPAFNLADVAIICGAGCLFVDVFYSEKQ